MIPVLASLEEFNRAGIDRQYFLTDLKFTPVLRPNGKSVIQVSSSKPVREPYLNFLVEVLWPNGRLLREYTLLLDPPLYSPETAAAAAPQLPISALLAPSSPFAPHRLVRQPHLRRLLLAFPWQRQRSPVANTRYRLAIRCGISRSVIVVTARSIRPCWRSRI